MALKRSAGISHLQASPHPITALLTGRAHTLMRGSFTNYYKYPSRQSSMQRAQIRLEYMQCEAKVLYLPSFHRVRSTGCPARVNRARQVTRPS
jgi:hypothetical protein